MAERGTSGRSLDRASLGVQIVAGSGKSFSALQSARFKRAGAWTKRTSGEGRVEVSVPAVDKAGNTADLLLRAHRDKPGARSFFEDTIERSGAPEKATIDKSGSHVAALEAIDAERSKPILVRQIKYLNKIVEQDHRAIKRRTRPMLGFKDLRCARILLSGLELMHMIRKGQMKAGAKSRTPAQQFYSLAA